MQIRTVMPEDHAYIVAVVDLWWGGRSMTLMLPKLFFVNFRDTSFIADADGMSVGFLIGFLSPALPDGAYIHFVGVHPDYRKRGVARALYERFFRIAGDAGRHRVRCVTSPINSASLAFHGAMGFRPEGVTPTDDSVPVHRDYDGPGEDRVLLVKELETPLERTTAGECLPS